jgi:CheY-like chemotaxis protein
MPVDDKHRQTQVRAAQPARAKANTHTVLVFADADRITEITSRLRRGSDYEIEHAASPIGATMSSLRSGASVVVIDVTVAGLPGGKLLQILRKQPRLSDVGIVLLCNSPEFDDVRATYVTSQRDDVLSTSMLDALLPTIERARPSFAQLGSRPLGTAGPKRPAQ